jgi:hypothetical protein
MKLIVRNNQGEEFTHHCESFDGYDIFLEARELWGNNWENYMVLKGTEVLENVLNPNTLDPENAERIH